MPLLDLPPEILLLIVTILSDRQLSCLLQANSHLYNSLLPYLYRRHATGGVDRHEPFFRTTATGNEQGARNFLYYGATIEVAWTARYCLHVGRNTISPWFNIQMPLNVAAGRGDDALVIMLLDHGAEVSGVARGMSNEHTQPAVVDALLSGHESTVRILLQRGSNLHGPLMAFGGLVGCAVETGQLAMLKLLVEFGADVTIPYDGKYPLYEAVCGKEFSTDIVRFLLYYGARTFLFGDSNGSLMAEVIRRGTIDIARLLLERGAVFLPDKFNSTVSNGTIDAIRLLIEYGIRPDIESLKKAVWAQRLDLLHLFIEEGVDLNARDSSGSTVLHYAVPKCAPQGSTRPSSPPGYPHILRYGLQRQLNVTPQQNVSGPCSIWPMEKDSPEDILRALIHMGADVNAKDGQGRTPLYLAWKYARSVVHILLASGATFERKPPRSVNEPT